MGPITSHVKGYPFEVAVNHRTIKGEVLADHLKNMDWKARGVTFACQGIRTGHGQGHAQYRMLIGNTSNASLTDRRFGSNVIDSLLLDDEVTGGSS
jgi:hypothetical protein